ncbi:organic cation/carnitine transporter 7-like protein, partial [Tanacetum coccineum]
MSLLTSITGLASASARNFTTLVVLRTFASIGTGGTQLYTPCFMEFVPVANRETWIIFFFVSSALGTSIEALMAWCIVPKYSWKWLVGATSLPSLVALVFYYRIPESPTFLSSKGELKGAYAILQKTARCNSKELPEGQLVPDPDETNRSNPVDIEDVSTLNAPLLENRIDGDP